MIRSHINIILSALLILALTSCFDNTGGDDNKPSTNEIPTDNQDNNGNGEPNNNGNGEPNNNGNGEPNNNGNETPVVVTPVIPKPTVPSFTIAGAKVTLNYSELELGYFYTIYFYLDNASESAKVEAIRTPVLTASLFSSGSLMAAYVASVDSAASSLGLDLTKNQTVYIRVQANDGIGNVSELSEPKQIKYLTAPAAPDISTDGNEITVEWSAESGMAYNLYYRFGGILQLDQATLVEGGPFTAGTATFTADNCANKYECSIALVATTEGSASAPTFANRFALTPTIPTAPKLSMLGSKMTVKYEQDVLPFIYSYDVYAAKEEFSDIANAFLIGSIKNRGLASTNTWSLPDSLGLDSLQDQILYVRVLARDSSPQKNVSALSDVQQIKYLTPPTDVTNITAIGRDLTIEWPVEAGKNYNAYIQNSSAFNFRQSTLITNEPSTDGVAKANCTTVCSIGITAIEGNSESDPIVVSRFNINLRGPTRSNSVRSGEQFEMNFTETQDGFSVYYSTTSPVTTDDTLLYDSEADGIKSTITHDIPAYYSAEGEPLSYYYGSQSFRLNSFTNTAGTTREFYAYSPLRNAATYAPVLNDFKLLDGSRSIPATKVEVSEGTLFSSDPRTNQLQVSPLNGDTSYFIALHQQHGKFEIDPADKNTVYYVTRGNGTTPAALHKVIKNGTNIADTQVDFPSTDNEYYFVDMVQSDTAIYLLTRARVMKIAKASIDDAGAFEVSDAMLDSMTTSYVNGFLQASPPTDLAISEDYSMLYIADSSGIFSLPVGDLATLAGSLGLVTPTPASLLAVNGSDLYFVNQENNGTIKRISLTGSGNTETVFQAYVTRTIFLKSAGDWLYFTSGNNTESNTYRKSMLDDTLERIAKLRAVSLAVDSSENGEGVYLSSGDVYHFPESYNSAPPLPPTIGELTTTPGDTSILVKITNPTPDAEAFGFEVNGVETSALVSGLPNGTPAEISVTAYNVSGPSESVKVTDTPVITVPRIIDTVEGVQRMETGVTSGSLSFYIEWTNPFPREITLEIYRSNNVNVDTTVSGNLLSTISFPVFTSGLVTHRHNDTELTNDQFYYYRAVLRDANETGNDSNEVAGMPYAPYSKLTDGAPLDGNLTADGSTLYWINNYYNAANPSINSVIKQYVSGSSTAGFLLTATTEYIAPSTTQLVAGLNTLYGIGSDKRVVEITQDLTFTGAGIVWEETLLATTSDVMNQVLLNGANLYLSGSGKVISVNTLTGTITELYSSIKTIKNLVEDGAYLYWLESGTTVKRILKTGDGNGDAETLITGVEIESFDVNSNNASSLSVSIFYSMRNGASFTISKYNVTDETTTALTEESLFASFALNDTGEVYAAVQKVSSNNSSYKAFVKIDAAGIESPVRKGVPKNNFSNGLSSPKLLSVGDSVYFTLPIAGIYKIQ